MRLAIQLLGTPQFQLDNLSVTAGRRAVVALLAYLAVTNAEHPKRMYSRTSLAALLWTNYSEAKALANLRHTLWEVNQFIGEGWVLTEHESVHWNPQADCTLDITQFHSSLNRALHEQVPKQRIPFLEDTAKLYRGNFLEGFILKDGDNFNEWAQSQAERLRSDFIDVLEKLMDDYSALDQTGPAVAYAQRLLTVDPLREDSHRKLMQLYASTDQRGLAIQQYQTLEKLLRKELNLDPQPETYELYKRIRKGQTQPASTKSKIAQQEQTKLKHNLPYQLTTFVGREKESDEVKRLLRDNRLVTLIGAGGIGKTRLVIRLTHSLLDGFSDGVWFIALETLTDEDLVVPKVASLFDIAKPSDHDLLETLYRYLSSKSLLLILDNCEHVLEACAQLAEILLKNCPNIKILTTSREVLRLEGEAVYQVPALGVPEDPNSISLGEYGQYESIVLFLERARLVKTGFELTQTNIKTVVRICDRLDGIPLAIELAAAYIDIFTLEEILQQLNHSFALLVSTRRSLLPRHQTMHACIDWSWHFLQEEEQIFIRRLAVFIGGWTLRAAEAVGLSNSKELTSGLVKKSFVIVHQQTKEESRYSFHEVIRAYALEKLILAGEEQTMRGLHLEYFLEFSRHLEPALRGVDQELWLQRTFTERDNIRAALEWAATTDVQAGLYLSNRLRAFWESLNSEEEARWLLRI